MPPNQQTPYDFIMAPQQKKRGLGLNGGSQKTRIIQVAIIAAIVLILGAIIIMIASGSGKGKTDNYLKLAAMQQDIIDITKAGNEKLRDPQLRTKNGSVELVIMSQNNETIKLISALGNKKPAKQIALLQVKTYSKTLDEADKNGNYDTVYAALLANRLDEYRVQLQAAYAGSSTETTKKQLSDYFQQLEVLYPSAAKTN